MQSGWRDASRKRAVQAGWRSTSRFGVDDFDASIGAVTPLPGGWSLAASASGSPTAKILARWNAAVTLQHSLLSGLNGSLNWRRSLYGPNGAVGTQGSTAWGGGLERYFGTWRAAWNGSQTRLDSGGDAFSQWGQIDRYYGESASRQASQVGLLVSAGHELEKLPGARLVVTSVRGISVLGVHRFTDLWGVSWELSSSRQGDSYRRTGFRLGLRRSI